MCRDVSRNEKQKSAPSFFVCGTRRLPNETRQSQKCICEKFPGFQISNFYPPAKKLVVFWGRLMGDWGGVPGLGKRVLARPQLAAGLGGGTLRKAQFVVTVKSAGGEVGRKGGAVWVGPSPSAPGRRGRGGGLA